MVPYVCQYQRASRLRTTGSAIVNYFFSEEELAFNDALDPWELLLRMGFQESQLYREGNTIRLFCPLHKDTIRRSMIIYTDRKAYKCQYVNCVGSKGGNLLEFYAAYTGLELGEVVPHIQAAGQGGGGDLIEQANKLIQEGNLVGALPILQKAVQQDPDNEISRCRLAALYLELGDRESGYREYMRAAEHFGLSGDLDKTLNIYNILVIISPSDTAVRKQLAALYSRLKRDEDAVGQLKWVVDRHIRRGELHEAAQMCRKMIDMCPQYPDSYRIIGEIFLKQGDHFQAADNLQAAAVAFINENNLTRAKQTVDLGLRYMPGNLALKDLGKKVDRAIELKQAAGESPSGESDREFESWLSELKSSVGLKGSATPLPARAQQGHKAPTAKPAPGSAPLAAAKPVRPMDQFAAALGVPPLDPNDPRIDLCLANLRDRSPDELESLYQHIVKMFHDVQQGSREGVVSELEKGVVLELYAAFCLAFDKHRMGGKSAAATSA